MIMGLAFLFYNNFVLFDWKMSFLIDKKDVKIEYGYEKYEVADVVL